MITAKLHNLRIAPRKVRLVADIIRGKSAEEALAILNFTFKKAANPIIKLLNSALSNAKNNFQLEQGNLYISKITVDEGRKLKRWRARARGSAYTILKRTSSVNLVLDEIKGFPSTRLRASKIKKSEKEAAIAAGPLTPSVGAAQKQEKPKPKPVAEVKKPVVSRIAKKIFRRQVF